MAGRRGSGARYTLSAAELTTIAAGMRLVLPSPNGSMIAHAMSPSVCFAGCLRNAAAVAEASLTHGGDIGVIAAGERWPNGTLRPALEDFLGAGAFVAALSGRKAPDAMAAAAAFISLRDDLPGALRGGLSGQELIAPGYAGDVDLAAELDLSDAAPRLVDGAFCARECEPMAPRI